MYLILAKMTKNNIPEAVNKLAFSAHLDHSCETLWNKHDSSYYSKQKFYYRVKKIFLVYWCL
jgi:hypothetical protein